MPHTDCRVSWEYKVVSIGVSSAIHCETLLTTLGSEGWDLICFQPNGNKAQSGEGTYFLKRLRRSP